MYSRLTTSHGQVIRIKRALELLQISRSSLYAKWDPKSPSHDTTFPQRIRLGAKTVGLLRTEVDAWVDAQAQARINGTKGGVQ